MLQAGSEMASPEQPDLKGKESKHGEFKEQDRNRLSARAEKVLRLLVKEEEENEQKMKDTSLPTKDLSGIKMPVFKQNTFKEGSKKMQLLMAEKTVELKCDMKMMRTELRKIKKAITVQECEVERLEDVQAHNNHCLEELCKLAEKQAVDAQSLLLKEIKSKQEMNDEIEKLTDKTGILKSEIAELEKDLNKYKQYRRILFTLSPPEGQEAQQAETLRAKVLPKSAEGLERFVDSSPDTVLPSTSESALSSDHSDTLVKNSKLDGDSTIYKENLELYFSDPQHGVDQLLELKDQVLVLCENLSRVDKTMEKTLEITEKKIKKDEEKLTKQLEDMEHRINFEKKQVAMLTKKVQIHESLKTDDEDIMLHALARKVTEVYSSCVNNQLTKLSTLEKLSSIERQMFLLQEEADSIPEKTLNELRHSKNSERKDRQQEEKRKLEMEKNREKLKKYMQRSMDEAKKPSGRKLMPRCFPVKQKIEVVDEDTDPAEDDVHARLFCEASD
ncbi:myosin-10-like [Archocentrus centrarchus]|uniref:myosin-10-like n=1 Tax=Archocentrus centrarchus TaxID=63155 RepID=UPI0011EA3CFD|nr:myosin-10-like [Archocentrus centrarchus]XP_030603003.1 myosin-10-like [Archocentrus centrarchus]